MRNIKYLVVHCTATPQSTTPQSILNYWKNTLKWKSPGYHVLVKADGTSVELLPIDQISNGVAGYNTPSIHISYIGGIDKKGNALDNRTCEQKQTILNYLIKWKKMFPKATIQGHRDFPGVRKECPSFNAKKEYQNLSDIK